MERPPSSVAKVSGQAMTQQPRPRVLVIDDHVVGLRALARLLEAEGFEVLTAASGTQALLQMQNSPPPRFVLTDLRLPDLDGLELAYHARRLEPPPWVALITGFAPEGNDEDHARWGLDFVFTKPLDMTNLIKRMRQVLGVDSIRGSRDLA